MLLTWGSGGGLNAGLSLWLPFNDLGAGSVNTAPNFSSGSATPTFTRATSAWCKLSSGLWVQVGTGVARSHYLGDNAAVGAYGGYFNEGAATNLCLQSRDLSNASWTKTTATAAKDQVGIDGAANSASSLLATAGAASCLQTITEAATASSLTCFVKRLVGTGTITIQQGASTLDITSLINGTTYTKVELNASVLNPAIGFNITTNGDKIAVDMVQFENGPFSTSPIPTTTVSVTRNADVLSYPGTGNVNSAQGTVYAEITEVTNLAAATAAVFISTDTNAAGRALFKGGGSAVTTISTNDNTTTVTKSGITNYTLGVPVKVAATWVGAALEVGQTSLALAAGAFDGSMGDGTKVSIGSNGAGGNQMYGTIANVKLWSIALTDGQVASL